MLVKNARQIMIWNQMKIR